MTISFEMLDKKREKYVSETGNCNYRYVLQLTIL